MSGASDCSEASGSETLVGAWVGTLLLKIERAAEVRQTIQYLVQELQDGSKAIGSWLQILQSEARRIQRELV